MNQRLTGALGIAALGIAATGLFMPQAAADSATNLAPGVDCQKLYCTNDTDKTYSIRYDAICLYPGAKEEIDTVPSTDLVSPHEHTSLEPFCGTRPGRKKKDNPVDGVAVDANYDSAEVFDPPPLPPLPGSAG